MKNLVKEGKPQLEEDLQKAVSEIFEHLNIKDSLDELDMLIEHVEELIQADYMWHDAAEDETSRRLLVAAIGVVAIKFATMDDEIIEFINEKKEEK